MTLCIVAQMLAGLANSHHDARITSMELVQAAQFMQKQCEDDKAFEGAKTKGSKSKDKSKP